MRHPTIYFLSRRRQWGLTAMLVFLALALFVEAPLRTVSRTAPVRSLLLLGAGVGSDRLLAPALAGRRSGGGGVMWLALRWSRDRSDRGVEGTGEIWLSLLTLIILTGLVLEHVFREGPITANGYRAHVMAYLLLGLVWTFGYIIVDRSRPGPSSRRRVPEDNATSPTSVS